LQVFKDQEFNIRAYARYVLKEGSIVEKRELFSCLKSKLVMKNKELSLTKWWNPAQRPGWQQN